MNVSWKIFLSNVSGCLIPVFLRRSDLMVTLTVFSVAEWKLNEYLLGNIALKTVREREPSSLPLHKLYTLFRLHFTPERNVQHSRADFFDLKREHGESAADVWKRIMEVEKKSEFETITAAELLASKFLSLIGKSTGDYEF